MYADGLFRHWPCPLAIYDIGGASVGSKPHRTSMHGENGGAGEEIHRSVGVQAVQD